jgi:hypothetical protein
MPILNFLKWLNIGNLSDKVVGEAIIMTANPIKDSKNNDYEASGITVSQLLETINGISIPKLFLKQNLGGGISVGYLPNGESDIWQQYNPKVYLFRYSKKKKKNVFYTDPVTGKEKRKVKKIAAGFKHVPHLDGYLGKGKFYGGMTKYPYNTEFDLMINKPYMTQPLFGFDPYQFYVYDKQQPLPKGLSGDILNNIYPANRKKEFARSVYFKFAIGIDNPDKTSEFPVLFGEMTEVLQVLPFKNLDGLIYLRSNLVPTGIKRK